MPPPFERSVFINCPFDSDFAPILQAIAFCVAYLGFAPRLAPENADNAVARLDRIAELIRESKYAIHDLSRCKAEVAGEYVRMNMPFELGLDHGCRRYGDDPLAQKSILVLEQTRYDYQRRYRIFRGGTSGHMTAISKRQSCTSGPGWSQRRRPSRSAPHASAASISTSRNGIGSARGSAVRRMRI